MSKVAIAIRVHAMKGETLPLVSVHPLNQLPVAQAWTVETVTAFLALPAVRADVLNQASTWRITLLKLLAWKVLAHHSPEQRIAQVDAWLPYPHHAGATGTGLTGGIQTMNRCPLPPTLPPFASHHHYRYPQLTLSALLKVLEHWQESGEPVDALLTAGNALATGQPLTEVPPPKARWWCCCC